MPFGEELFCSIEKESPGVVRYLSGLGYLTPKLENLGFSLRTHMVEEKTGFCEVSVI